MDGRTNPVIKINPDFFYHVYGAFHITGYSKKNSESKSGSRLWVINIMSYGIAPSSSFKICSENDADMPLSVKKHMKSSSSKLGLVDSTPQKLSMLTPQSKRDTQGK